MWKKFLPFFIFLLILFSIGYFLLTLPSPPVTNSSQLSIPECEEGEIESCFNEDDCEGTKVCNKGEWGNCIVPMICIPGSKLECGVGCDTGYKECNECGTGYLECISS